MKIPDDVISAIRLLEPDALESHGFLSAAPKGANGENTYICPNCGNGSGKDGDGLVVFRDPDKVAFHCYVCGKQFDAFDIIAHHFGLDSHHDFVAVCNHAAAEFGLDFDADFAATHNLTPKPAPKREPPTPDPAKINLIRADIKRAQENLDNLPEDARRGLSLETLRHFGCGYLEDWTSPGSRLAGTFSTPTPRLIIPSGDHYLARLTVPLDSFPETARPFIHEKAHAGSKDVFLSLPLSELTNNDFITVFEGEIDAMSFWQITHLPAAATGGASNFKRFVDFIAASTFKPRILIIFDSDSAGRDNAPKFRDALLNIGAPAICRFLSNDISKLDLNDLLRNNGAEAVENALYPIIIDSDLQSAWLDASNSIAERALNSYRAVSTHDKLAADIIDKLFALPQGDVGNARRISLLFGDTIRFLTKTERWMLYSDGTWDITTKSPSNLYNLANNIQGILKAYLPPANKCSYGSVLVDHWGKKSKICNAIELLKGEPNIQITRDDLNTHFHLLNVQNGVVDLRSGLLFPHDPALLFTQKINVPYIPGFRNDTVENFFRSVVPDDATRAALLRFLGYCLTGECCEELALFIWGKGGNGKGTLTNMLMRLFNDFACAFPIKAVLKNQFEQGADAATTAFNMLLWARLAIAEEIPAGGALDYAKFKLITGRDPIPVRPLYGEYSVIKRPTHSMIFSGNYLPELKDPNDTGIQRRLLNINFDQDFTQNPDVHLKDRLVEEDSLKALLAMLVSEAVAYYRDGLLVSDEMRQAKAEYLADQDFIAEFISEHCEYAENASIPRPALVKKIKAECDSARDMSNKAICSALERIPKLSKYKTNGTIYIKGICWRDSPEQPEIL